MGNRLSASEVSLLGLVGEKSSHGYELENLIEKRGLRNWTSIGFSSIYYLLDKLEAKGLIDATASSKKTQRAYSISKLGKKTLRAEVIGYLESAQTVPNNFGIGLSYIDLLTKKQAVEALEKRLQRLKERLVGLRQKQDEQQPLPWQAETLFGYSANNLESEIAWLAKTISKIEDRNSRK